MSERRANISNPGGAVFAGVLAFDTVDENLRRMLFAFFAWTVTV